MARRPCLLREARRWRWALTAPLAAWLGSHHSQVLLYCPWSEPPTTQQPVQEEEQEKDDSEDEFNEVAEEDVEVEVVEVERVEEEDLWTKGMDEWALSQRGGGGRLHQPHLFILLALASRKY